MSPDGALDDALDEWWDGLSEDRQHRVLAVRHGSFDYHDPVREILDSSGCRVSVPWVCGPAGVAAGVAFGCKPGESVMPANLREYLSIRFPE